MVHVISARNLPALDSNGLSDPYLEIHYGDTIQKTTVKMETLNPIWDEKFVM